MEIKAMIAMTYGEFTNEEYYFAIEQIIEESRTKGQPYHDLAGYMDLITTYIDFHRRNFQ